MICTVEKYRQVTGDLSTEDYKVTAALTDAQALAEEFCQRQFESATRTETLKLFATGRIYPKAFPITSVTGMPGAIIDGWSILVGYGYQYSAGVNPFVSGFGQDTIAWIPQITVTYVGGYAEGNAPPSLVRAVAQLAYDELHPTVLDGVPYGATSVTVGDMSLSGQLSAPTSLRPAVRYALNRYRRPQVVAFS